MYRNLIPTSSTKFNANANINANTNTNLYHLFAGQQ
ncbi:predicted protein [Sclerotinia sclerotiorum 1980 UF-70]|uniref:Uncharacterized protein n=1 Tax=Sclerotinia sclerotiorum (strain ATCC 18683 / 1980 / Ss-1) TaxID=665079 RepID=A7ELN6_SCLS1|nr:predicted protein [Sclerotinia sclerotiorum 1980 UF-70]EDO03752.1 predicted protein [Sclerotinia sclerotiorum 1980 UF-70]